MSIDELARLVLALVGADFVRHSLVLVCGERNSLCVDFYVVDIEEKAKLGAVASCKRLWMPMNHTIVMAVNAVLDKVRSDWVFQSAREIGKETIAVVKAIRDMPVIVNRWRGVLAGR